MIWHCINLNLIGIEVGVFIGDKKTVKVFIILNFFFLLQKSRQKKNNCVNMYMHSSANACTVLLIPPIGD